MELAIMSWLAHVVLMGHLMLCRAKIIIWLTFMSSRLRSASASCIVFTIWVSVFPMSGQCFAQTSPHFIQYTPIRPSPCSSSSPTSEELKLQSPTFISSASARCDINFGRCDECLGNFILICVGVVRKLLLGCLILGKEMRSWWDRRCFIDGLGNWCIWIERGIWY
jgi:hypothetical protein